MEKSEQLSELFTALSKVQSELKAAEKDRTNPYFDASYTTLQSVWDCCREALTKNGLSVIQSIESSGEGKVYLKTILAHSSGQYVSSATPVYVDRNSKNYMQALGSAITYARRYSLSAMVGVTPDEDDDANAAISDSKTYSNFNSTTSSMPVKASSVSSKVNTLPSTLTTTKTQNKAFGKLTNNKTSLV